MESEQCLKINSEYSCELIVGISGGECFWALH